MTRSSPLQAVMFTSVAFGALCAGAGVANAADGFTQNNLISNIRRARNDDRPQLVNPWGVSFANGSPIWISDQAHTDEPAFCGDG